MIKKWLSGHGTALLLAGFLASAGASFSGPLCRAEDEDFDGSLEPVEVDEERILYRFLEHFEDAEVAIRDLKDKVLEKAQWNGEYFEFLEFGSKHRVENAEGIFGGENRQAIRLYAAADSQKRIRFFKVPAGSKIFVGYGRDDAGFNPKDRSNIYLKVWAGEHLLTRIRISNEKGWKRQLLDLGVVPFLLDPIHLSFEVMSDANEGLYLYLEAAVI